MSEIQITHIHSDFGHEKLRHVERKLIIGSLALGVALLALLGLLARI